MHEAKGGDTAAGGAILVVRPGEGKSVHRRYGEQTVIKVAQAETRGAYAVRENAAPAGFGGVPLHIHHTAEEAFYVLDGELTVYAADAVLPAPAGSFVLIPRGTPHSFANRGPAGVRWLTILSPAWVSAWVEEESELLRSSAPGEPDAAALRAIGERYGLEVVGPPPPARPG
jgi:mannose-6-phosphate isomerase-like protein (cupin superfamily)